MDCEGTDHVRKQSANGWTICSDPEETQISIARQVKEGMRSGVALHQVQKKA